MIVMMMIIIIIIIILVLQEKTLNSPVLPLAPGISCLSVEKKISLQTDYSQFTFI